MLSVFVDANVIIDFLDQKRQRHSLAVQALAALSDKDFTPVVTEDLLTTIYYVVRDKAKILDFFDYILTNWIVVPFGLSLLEHTVDDCRRDHKIDFEDRAQAYAALRSNCSWILTNDSKFAALSGISCCSPEDFIS